MARMSPRPSATSRLASSFIVATLASTAFGCSKEPVHANPPVGTDDMTHDPPMPTTTASTPASASATEESSLPTLKGGDDAPALSSTASNGKKIDLAAMKGKTVVVYFYPKDDTPGCTKEACAFRDSWSKLEKANIVVVGVSEDSDESHRAFTEKYKLPLSLVADTDGAIAKRFGVPVNGGYASRMSFLIGKDGKIKKVYPQVDPAIHCDEILTDAAG